MTKRGREIYDHLMSNFQTWKMTGRFQYYDYS